MLMRLGVHTARIPYSIEIFDCIQGLHFGQTDGKVYNINFTKLTTILATTFQSISLLVQ